MANLPETDLQYIVNNPNCMVIINGFQNVAGSQSFMSRVSRLSSNSVPGGSGHALTCYVTNDLSLSSRGNFGQHESNPLTEGINKIIQHAGKFAASLSGSGQDFLDSIPQRMVKNVAGTIQLYQGTENFSFDIDLLFIALSPEDDITQQVKTFFRATNPTFEGGLDFATLLKAPNDYSFADINAEPKGAFSVSIGKWFRTKQQFILTGFDATFSKETIKNGTPLYATGKASFTSFRILSADEIENMFSVSPQ